jgi:hypothetical protein
MKKKFTSTGITVPADFLVKVRKYREKTGIPVSQQLVRAWENMYGGDTDDIS